VEARDITDAYRRTLNTLEQYYIEYKRDNGLYDFTDYPLYLYDVMNTYNEYIYNIDALFVDEFQDVDSTQFEIFKKVLSKKKFYIGDAWQSIFQFRGADGAVFTKLEDFDLYKLDYNYRSYQEIINYACEVYQELKWRVKDDEECYITQVMNCDESSIICNRGYGGEVVIIDPFGNGNKIQNKVNYYIGSSEQKRYFDQFIKTNPMILCRTNKQVKAIQEFGYTNVSTVHQAKGLEYENVIVIDTVIKNMEDLNIAYVALTRARDNMLVMSWSNLEQVWLQKTKKMGFGYSI
jgi:ATP-dependent exoDNAse (exonuclease V) beta subunit